MAKSNFIVRGGGDFSGLYKELNQAQKQLNGFKSGIGKTLKGVTALFGGIAVGRTIKDFVQVAARTETMAVAMNSVARSSGYATAAVNEHKKAVMDMGIAEQEAMQIMTRFMQARLDTADASRLARVAQDAAVIANMNSSEAAEQMTEAIAKQRPILLSQFGMTKNLNEIYKEYATRLGKTATQLTTAEKKQAMLNYILQEGNKIAGTYEASMGAVGKQIGSLPRYYDTLKNAIATPLALPGLSVAVEGITNALKNAIAWAEANEATLRVWGQNVANIVSGVVTAFSWVTRTLANNRQMIKLVGTGLISYAAATKIVTGAVGLWKTVNLLLNGTLTTQIPLLSTASKAVAIYRTQMALAPVATNIFTAALLKLRVALQAVHAAIGPVGWAILAISALLTGGMILWNKYNSSLDDIPDLDQELADALQEIEDSALGATDGQEDLADGIDKAGKAAKGALAPFDEINQLQQNLGSGVGGLGGLGGLGNPFEGLNIKPPKFELDTKEVTDAIEESKRKWKGFFIWINDWWNNIKGTLMAQITIPAPVFAAIPNPIYEPNWGLELPPIEKPVFQPIPNPVYKPNWGLDYPVLQPLAIPALDLKQYNLSLENMKKNFEGAKTRLEGLQAELSKKLEEETERVTKKIETGLSTAWATRETNYNAHKNNMGVIATAISAVVVANLNNGILTSGRNTNTGLETIQTSWNTFGRNVGLIAAATGLAFASNLANPLDITNINFGSFFNSTLPAMKSWGEGMLAIAAQTGKGILNNIVNSLSSAWENIKSFWNAAGERVSGWFSENKRVITTTAIVAGVAVGVGALALAAPAAIPYIGTALGGLATIPALAKGGITNGPMVAMIGDNPGGKEVVSPLDDLMGMITSAVGTAIMETRQFDSQSSSGDIILQIDGTTFARIINPYNAKENERIGNSVIIQPV